MANTRIRYKNNFGRLVSNNMLIGTEYGYVTLIPNDLEGGIILNTDLVLKFKAKSLSELKKKAKQELIKLGAKFNQEIRNRGNTEKLDITKIPLSSSETKEVLEKLGYEVDE